MVAFLSESRHTIVIRQQVRGRQYTVHECKEHKSSFVYTALNLSPRGFQGNGTFLAYLLKLPLLPSFSIPLALLRPSAKEKEELTVAEVRDMLSFFMDLP